jgi:ribonuclease-3
VNRIEANLRYRFRDGTLLETALTHRSYPAEHEDVEHNERMEFLGDAVLEFVMTDLLYETFRDMREGQLAKLRASLVSRAMLASVARDIGLGKGLRMGHGEEISEGRDKDSILADAMEAVLCAVYLDGGVDAARAVIVQQWSPRIAARATAPGGKDYKTRLQEVLATVQLNPVYRVVGEGPDHDRLFTATVEIDGTARGRGEGRSKKEAEQAAAKAALDDMSD